MNRKQQQYKEEVLPSLKKRFNYSNDLETPKLVKIVISRGVNAEESKTASVLDDSIEDIAVISGQKPITRKATKSIATFKIREGMINGIMVTLRKERMYAFFDKFVSVASPRVRDFQGFKIKSDGHGNFTVGIKDQRIFIEAENRTNKGLQITIVTTAESEEEARALLEVMGFPFSKN